MRFVAVLNRDGGTLRTTNLDTFSEHIARTLEAAGHQVTIEAVAGKDLDDALDKAVRSHADVVLVGGGDGTVSAAAARLKGKGKALAVLPAGTMNLFARSLGVPLDINAAVTAFTDGEIRDVDIASANGRPFVHQFSLGMHARMVHLRENMEFASRLGKMRASAKAAWNATMDAKAFTVSLDMGETQIKVRTTGIGISNNLFGEGHLPYADDPDGGKLGIYVTVARQRHEIVKFLWRMMRGKWQQNDQVEIHEAGEVVLTLPKGRRKMKCVMDGELGTMDLRTTISIHPGALKVLVPRAQKKGKAA